MLIAVAARPPISIMLFVLNMFDIYGSTRVIEQQVLYGDEKSVPRELLDGDLVFYCGVSK